MRIIDRYVTFQVARTLATVLVSLVALYILFDLADHRRGDILRHAVPARAVASYYIGWVPVIVAQMSPVALMLSTLYVLGMMAKNNELTAMLAGGINLRRVSLGPICLAVVFGLGVFAMSEWVMPQAVRRARVIEHKYFDGGSGEEDRRLVWIEPDRAATVSVKRYDPEEHVGYELLITQPLRDGSRLAIQADRMVWDAEQRVWLLLDGERTVYGHESQHSEPFTREVSYIQFEPDEIDALNVPADELSAGQLRRVLIELGRHGMVSPTRWVDYHEKLAMPALNFIIVFLAIPFALRTARGGLAASLAVSVVLGLAYVCSFGLCVGLARAMVVPGWLGVWFANAVFLAGGVWMYARMPT